ncbi:MAG: hypothetical protein NC419_09610 [Muribaculaceae bacterium]|nr:hypothetical protein [Muribaculaceae bacterium]
MKNFIKIKIAVLFALCLSLSAVAFCGGQNSMKVYAYTDEEKAAAKAWLSQNGYSPDMSGAEQAYQDYLNGKFGPVSGGNTPTEEEPAPTEEDATDGAQTGQETGTPQTGTDAGADLPTDTDTGTELSTDTDVKTGLSTDTDAKTGLPSDADAKTGNATATIEGAKNTTGKKDNISTQEKTTSKTTTESTEKNADSEIPAEMQDFFIKMIKETGQTSLASIDSQSATEKEADMARIEALRDKTSENRERAAQNIEQKKNAMLPLGIIALAGGAAICLFIQRFWTRRQKGKIRN